MGSRKPPNSSRRHRNSVVRFKSVRGWVLFTLQRRTYFELAVWGRNFSLSSSRNIPAYTFLIPLEGNFAPARKAIFSSSLWAGALVRTEGRDGEDVSIRSAFKKGRRQSCLCRHHHFSQNPEGYGFTTTVVAGYLLLISQYVPVGISCTEKVKELDAVGSWKVETVCPCVLTNFMSTG